MTAASAITTIAFDADDTLWLNEHFYQLTESKFAALLADYCDPADLGAQLLATERRNLRLYGYGIKGFVLSMIETALELSDNRIPAATIRQLIDMGHDFLEHPVELLPGVQATIEALQKQYRLILITKGDLFDQERKIALSGLAEHFQRIEIVSEKTTATYREIFTKHADGPERAVMVGNSLKSDILPALAAGCRGVYVPHDKSWAMEHAEKPQNHRYFREIAQMSQLADVLLTLV